MKRWKDPFPPTPQAFHDRLEQTLRGLEDTDMRENRHYKKLTALLIAALVALLAIGAVAAVIGSNRLKQDLTDAGANDLVGRVQDVHLIDAADGFGFSIDEVVWEGQELYLSYTLAVPDDGNTYLVGLMEPTINGEPVNYRSSRYLDRSFVAMAMGGDYPVTHTFVLPVLADSRELELRDLKLDVRAAFFRTDRPFEYVPDFYEEGGMYDTSEAMTLWTGGIVQQRVFPTADTLYYWDEDDGVPLLALDIFQPVLEAMAAEDAEAKGHIAITYGSDGWPQIGLAPAGLDSTGIASLVAERSVALPLSADMVSHDLYNGLAENTFRYDGMTITVENFRMTHFTIEADIWMLPDEGVPENDGEVDFDRFPTLCVCVNGELMLGSAWGGTDTMADGVLAYCEDCLYDGYVPLGNLEKVELAVCTYDAEVEDIVIDEVVAKLTPVLDETAAEEEAAALVTREAAGRWQPGDADITVWATGKGTYYHLDPKCSGMRNAVQWHIANAVEAGKKPCPVCAGGEPAPAQWEEGEDISCFGN